MTRTDPERPSSVWSRSFSTRGVADWVDRRRVALAIGLGVVLRLVQYAYNRGFWMDEMSLVANIRGLSPAAMFGPLENNQLAPPGFLVAEWVTCRAFGESTLVQRLVPLLGGIASMFLIAEVARRVLRPQAVWVAVALFAVSGDLIYYASEAKQYSTDVGLALTCLLLGLTVGSRPLTPPGAALLAASGSAIVWFSHPSIFVLAGVGVVGLARAILGRDPRSAVAWVVVGLAWVGSFAGVHAVAMAQLGHRRDMWAFWAFAFPPVPPRSAWDASWPIRRAALIFVDPLNFDSPIGPSLSELPAVGLCLIGCGWIGRVDRGRLALLVLPGVFALLASYLRLYPFHGRLLLFFVPTILVEVAAGLDAVRGRARLHAVLMAVVLGIPAATAVFGIIEPTRRNFANPYGDLRPKPIDPFRFPF